MSITEGVHTIDVTATTVSGNVTATGTATAYIGQPPPNSGLHRAEPATQAVSVTIERPNIGDHQAAVATQSASGTHTQMLYTISTTHNAKLATQDAAGKQPRTGSGEHQASTATHVADGTHTQMLFTASSSHTAASANHAADGTHIQMLFTTSSTHQADVATHVGSGTVPIRFSATHQAQPATHSSAGEIRPPLFGDATHKAGNATQAATAETREPLVWSASHKASVATQSASGDAFPRITGSAVHQAKLASQQGTLTIQRFYEGSANHQAKVATVNVGFHIALPGYTPPSAAVDWPDELPQSVHVDGFQMNQGQGAVKVEMDSGPNYQRQRYSATSEPFEFEMVLSRSQYSVFRWFYKMTTAQGSVKFNWKHPITGTPAEVQFDVSSPPKTEIASGMYLRVKCKMEVLP